MGLFGGLKRAPAAAMAQERLELAFRACFVDGSPLQVAHDLVKALWAGDPAMMDGKTGPKPHKVAIAAAALAVGVQTYPAASGMRGALMYALGLQLQYVQDNGRMLPLHDVDKRLLVAAGQTFREAQEAFEASDEGRVIGQILDGGQRG